MRILVHVQHKKYHFDVTRLPSVLSNESNGLIVSEMNVYALTIRETCGSFVPTRK